MGLQFARAFCGLFVLLGISQVLLAQENYKNASIAVRVTDPSGAAVKNAEVRFVEQARGDHGIKRTDKTGWVLAELKPGDYEIKVTGSGSKSKVIRYAEVTAAEHKQLEVSLEAISVVPVCCEDPVERPIEQEYVEPRDTEIRQDPRQSTATAPIYLPAGQTDASVLPVILAHFREPSLLEAAKDATVRSVRATYFSPVPVHEVAVRLTVNADGSGQVTSAVSSGGEKGVTRTTNIVSKMEVDKLFELVDKAGFWVTLSTEPEPDKTGRRPYVLDGAWWMLEGVQNGSFHYVFRRNPKPTPITEIACYLAKNLVKANNSVVSMVGCAPRIQTSHASNHRSGRR